MTHTVYTVGMCGWPAPQAGQVSSRSGNSWSHSMQSFITGYGDGADMAQL